MLTGAADHLSLTRVQICICGSQTGKTIQAYKGHSGPVTSLAFYKISKLPRELLFTGSWDKSIRVWDVEVGAETSSIHKESMPYCTDVFRLSLHVLL